MRDRAPDTADDVRAAYASELEQRERLVAKLEGDAHAAAIHLLAERVKRYPCANTIAMHRSTISTATEQLAIERVLLAAVPAALEAAHAENAKQWRAWEAERAVREAREKEEAEHDLTFYMDRVMHSRLAYDKTDRLCVEAGIAHPLVDDALKQSARRLLDAVDAELEAKRVSNESLWPAAWFS